jgi:hypothetical protein
MRSVVELGRMFEGVELTDEAVSFSWHLMTYYIFSMKSLYADYMNGHTWFLKNTRGN